MRAFYIIFLLVFLASCRGDAEIIATPQQTEQQEEAISTDDSDAEEETLGDMESEMDAMDSQEESDEQAAVSSEIVTLDAGYTNPKGPVDMQVSYALNSAGTIETISVSATTYDVSGFNSQIQSVVGMSLEEASDTYISGSSLTSAAFNNALKDA